MTDKSDIQAEQYQFPYHYLVDWKRQDFVRNLDWGLDYLTYMTKVMDLVEKYVRRDVLDVGCGDGFLLNNLARHTDVLAGRRSVGIDLDGKAILFARAFGYGLPDVTFLKQDITTYDDAFGLITAVETFEHIPDDHLDTFTRNIDRILKRGGHLIISVPSKVRPVIEKHYRHYDLAMLQGYFPEYEAVDVHYVTARSNLGYQVISKLLANRHVNMNVGPIGDVLLGLHDRFTSDVSEKRGAHVVAAFRKP